jgi:hypothetical protein
LSLTAAPQHVWRLPTAEESVRSMHRVNEREAIVIVYDGKLWPRSKSLRMSSLAFRAVRDGGKGT